MNESYSAIANYYDSFTHNDCDYESWSQYLFEVANKHHVKRVVDIACGTGKMTELLVKSGLQAIGVDVSEQMLACARQKVKATFVLQDMQRLCLPSAVDMAVCVNDGVNYLKPQQLLSFFARVCQNLKSGAPFVFDVSSPYKLKEVVGNNVFYLDEQEATLLWTNALKKDSVTMSLTLFERQGDKYLRSDESHTQYIHEQALVVDCLRQAGFEVVQISADYGKRLTEKALRTTYYAVKK